MKWEERERGKRVKIKIKNLTFFSKLRSFKVIRTQLPQDNKYYTDENHEDDIQMKEETNYKYP